MKEAHNKVFDLEFIKAMADPVRQEIFLLIADKGRMTSGAVAEAFSPMTHATISHHLQILKRGGVLVSEKEGKEAWYDLDRSNLTNAVERLADIVLNCCKDSACCRPAAPKRRSK